MTDGLTWRVVGARREVEGARLPARAQHYPTLTVVSRAAGANMRHMQMKGAAGRTRERGGKQHCVHCADNAESQCRVSKVKSGYDGHERRDSDSAILFFFYFLEVKYYQF